MQGPIDPTTSGRSAGTGAHQASKPAHVPLDGLETEWGLLQEQGYFEQVVSTLLASRRDSTKRVYSATWRTFCRWSARTGMQPLKAKICHVLTFLQGGLSRVSPLAH